MPLTSKPDDWTGEEWAEYQRCEADAIDIQSQMQNREYAYERGDITWDEYQNWEFDSWEFDYGPSDDAAPKLKPFEPPVEKSLDDPPF